MRECVEVLLNYSPVGKECEEYQLAVKYMNLKLTKRHWDILLDVAVVEEISQRNDLILWGLLTIEGELTSKGRFLVQEIFPVRNLST